MLQYALLHLAGYDSVKVCFLILLRILFEIWRWNSTVTLNLYLASRLLKWQLWMLLGTGQLRSLIWSVVWLAILTFELTLGIVL